MDPHAVMAHWPRPHSLIFWAKHETDAISEARQCKLHTCVFFGLWLLALDCFCLDSPFKPPFLRLSSPTWTP